MWKWLTVVLMAGLMACGGMSEEDAGKAWEATNEPIENGGAPGALVSVDQTLSVGDTYDAQCAGGGTATFTAKVAIDTTGGTNVNVDYDVAYKACVEDGITVDGTIRYYTSVTTSMTGSKVEAGYSGSLSYTGDVEGECDVDVKTVVEAGTTTNVSVTGDFCGFDADAVIDTGGFSF